MKEVKIIECPRDAMQGIKKWIPTNTKVTYIQSLLEVGFHTLDCGSFVSPRYIPQLKDTAEVIKQLDTSSTQTKLLVIIANMKGAIEACKYSKIDFLGYPFSISEIFQMRNTNKTIEASVSLLREIVDLAIKNDKEVVAYLSMGFGNPYGEPWSYELVEKWVEILKNIGVNIISLSDTVGLANPKDISAIFRQLRVKFSAIEFGAHFHCEPNNYKEKVEAALNEGCLRFDSAIGGYGGCPMSNHELVGNLPTEKLLSFLVKKNMNTSINSIYLNKALEKSKTIF